MAMDKWTTLAKGPEQQAEGQRPPHEAAADACLDLEIDDSGKLLGAHGPSGPLPALGHEKEPSKKDAVGAGLETSIYDMVSC
jgi:hypothetical protein